jgi:hypothetical protein
MERREKRSAGIYPPSTQAQLGAIVVDPVTDADEAFVVGLKMERAKRFGDSPVQLTPGATYLVAKRRMTGEPLGCMAVAVVPPAPGRALVEDFLVVPGRWGKIAAYAMLERLRKLGLTKVGMVRVENEAMRKALEGAGMKITSYVMEG